MNSPEPDKNNHAPIDTAQSWVNLEAMLNSTTAIQLSQIERLSPIALAYIGDAVFELYVRTQFLMPPKRMTDYHSQVVTQVRAESQAVHLAILLPELTDSEKEILRRGRNACVTKPRRLARQTYQKATGLEALIGYLYLTNPQRLQELFSKLNFDVISD
ncbi:MAG: Mini-ribonuclease 3 [Waterburya sp.]